MKKIAGFLIAAAVLFHLINFPAAASTKTVSGMCGTAAAFTIDENGTLTITGTGKIDKFFFDDKEIEYKKIIKIIMSEGITELGKDCFCFLENVTLVKFPTSLQIIGENAMHGMKSLTEIQLPSELSQIGEMAFYHCNNITELQIPDTVSQIGPDAFAYCKNLQRIRLPRGLKKIENGLFQGCEKLIEIPAAECLQEIGLSSFSFCHSLQNAAIPDTVKKIGAHAFWKCKNLKKLTFGSSVKKVAATYAQGCVKLRTVANRSSVSIPLNEAKGSLSWYVGKKKRKSLPPGKTAKAKGRKYAISYILNGGKIKGRKPKYHEYGKAAKLPSQVVRKGYTFLGWNIYGEKSFDEWGLLQSGIKAESREKLQVQAVFKKYKVTVKNQSIHVLVQGPLFGKKGYSKADDHYGFRYSEHPDMSHSVIVSKTAPYGKGMTDKLEKGKTYYVQIAAHGPDFTEEDDEDFPLFGWVKKKKVTIT